MSEPAARGARGRPRLPKVELAAAGLRFSGVGRVLRRLPRWHGLIVLSYHRVGDGSRSDLYRALWGATPEQLDAQLRRIKRSSDVIAPQEFSRDLLATPGRRVMVTFDDGYRDLYEAAHPVLTANGIRAAMFLCSGFIDRKAQPWWDEIAWMLRHSNVAELAPGPWSSRKRLLSGAALELTIEDAIRAYWRLDETNTRQYLGQLAHATGAGRRPPDDHDWITWDMARSLKASGHMIGAHTVSHPVLSQVSPARQREEIAGSVDRIAAEIGERPRWLAYPVGTYDAVSRIDHQIVEQTGIELAFSNYGGHITSQSFVPYDVRRISAESRHSPALLEATLTLPQLFARPGVRQPG